MPRPTTVVATVLCALLSLTGCGGNDQPSGPLATKVIDVTVNGDSVTPNGDRVPVAVGQRIELDVTADAPGEIHVHSSPEQEFEYDKGSTTIEVKPISAPGIVAVESHTLDKVILQLQVK
jgi:phage-related baseplate assembly protein